MAKGITTSYFRVSTSKIKSYLWCPRKYYYSYVDENRNKDKKTFYRLLMGSAAHNHVQKMHEKGNSRNPFYYKTAKSAMGGFNGRWGYTIKENDKEILDFARYGFEDGKPKGYEIYRDLGRVCINNYWNQMYPLVQYGRGKPYAVEKRLVFNDVDHEVSIEGRVDEIREIPLTQVHKWNPDVIDSDGNLKEGYLPFIQIDLKTGGHSFTPNGETEKVVKKKWFIRKRAKSQFPLHQDIQATTYTYLFDKNFGGLPIAFVFYYLRSGEFWPTYRTREDYTEMFEKINHLRGNLEIGSFPKRVSERNCSGCLHFKKCSQENDLVVVNSFREADDLVDKEVLAQAENKEEPKQLKFKMKVPRRKKET